MSQIKLKHSGGNSVIIAAPDSNPASDRTLKLPSDGDGTILTTNSPTGKLLQVVQTVKTDVSSYSLTNPGFTADVMTVSITPANANNKIMIDSNIAVGGMFVIPTFAYYKDGSVITGAIGDAGTDSNGNALNRTTMINYNARISTPAQLHMKYLDTAGGTSSITYSVRLSHNRNASEGAKTLYINRIGITGETYSTYLFATRVISTLTVTEIAA